MSIIKKIEDLITNLLAEEKMELVDLQYVTASGKKNLRIFLDKEGGIKLDDCEHMTNVIGSVLDESGLLPDSYILEISSPGLDRVLKKEKDFIRFIGSKIKVTVYTPINGQRNFLGKIISVENGDITLDDINSKNIVISIDKIVKARLEPEI